MNPQQEGNYLLCVIIVSLLGAVFNTTKYPSRGKAAFYLTGAFVSFAAAALCIKIGAGQVAVSFFGSLTFMLIAADAMFRLGRQKKGNRR